MSSWYDSLIFKLFLKIDLAVITIFVCCIAICMFIENKRNNGASYKDVQRLRSIRRAKWAWVGMFTGYFSITTFEAAQYIIRHRVATEEMLVGTIAFGMLGTLAGGLWGSIKGRRMQSADGFGSADAILYNGTSLQSQSSISMTKISASTTHFYKRTFPLILGGFMLVFILREIKYGMYFQAPVIFFIIVVAIALDAFMRKKFVSELSDEVYDCGEFLFVINNEIEERVELSNIMKVNFSTMTTPPKIFLQLIQPGRLGQQVTFSPITPFLNLPFLKNKIAEDLIVRVDQAKKRVRSNEVASDPVPASPQRLAGNHDYCIDTTIGRIFKDRFIITADSITYGKITLPFSDISRLRWCIYYHGDDFYKKDVSYQVCFGSASTLAVIECALDLESDSESLNRYNTIVCKIWNAVGISMLSDIINRISKGEVVCISEYVSADADGLFLPTECLYDMTGNIKGYRGEQIHCNWSDISYVGCGCQGLDDIKGDKVGYWGETHRTWSDNGRIRQSECLRLTSKNDNNLSISLSYRDTDNTHIIEALLSYLLEGNRYCNLKQGKRQFGEE